MAIEGYDFSPPTFVELLLRRFFPEKTDHESALLLEYLRDHLEDYDRVSFSVRIGEGVTPDTSIPPAIAAGLVRSSRRRIDFVGWQGELATIVEMKTRLGHAVMGQLLSDAQLWSEEFPDGPAPRLVALGRDATDEDIRVLTAHGIDVHLYAPALAE